MPVIEHLTLPNGLDVVLCHAPRLKRCAASLRVAAGSHDVPGAWPGLAHFLEHLFFLGSERFADQEKLMSFVQRHGGQLNASTRERTTDFFFELPSPVFAQGLERLCEMLTQPRLSLADQRREREVLHAEFIAWARAPETHQQQRRLQALSARHPLRGFHAGNRYSLPVPNPAFQHALQVFYRRFYQAQQITLCLAGPLPLDQLKTLATLYGGYFSCGNRVQQAPPPRLFDHPATFHLNSDSELLVACEDLPEGADQAAAFLCHCLNGSQTDEVPEPFKAQLLYQFAGQVLFRIEASTPAGTRLPELASTWVQDWLALFKTRWPDRVDDYNRLQQRRLEVSGALQLAHYYARNLPQGLSAQGRVALIALLEQLQPNAQTAQIPWQLPQPNPFLDTSGNGDEGAFYLRWQLQAPQPEQWRALNRRLEPLSEAAQQAGVNLEFSAYGAYWQLKLCGLAAPLPMILQHTLELLKVEDAGAHEAPDAPPPIAIRQLLKDLPDRYLNAQQDHSISDIQSIWLTAQWISFATGLNPNIQQALDNTLILAPGMQITRPEPCSTLQPGKHWHCSATPAGESAVLLFCPAPTASVADEAAWRLLAHLLQTPFYQRLRVELQLGYAVFSGLRQIDGRTGLLFGVQSPSASAQQLIQHIQTFLEHLETLVQTADLPAQAQALAAQLDFNGMETSQAAETFWQAHLAGHNADYLQALQDKLLQIDTSALLNATASLLNTSGGWLCLSNSHDNRWPEAGSLPKLQKPCS